MSAHIPPHVIWANIYDEIRLTPSAQDHILKCEECLETVLLCLKSESFRAVLRALGGSSGHPLPTQDTIAAIYGEQTRASIEAIQADLAQLKIPIEPAGFVMTRRMLMGLKQRADSAG